MNTDSGRLVEDTNPRGIRHDRGDDLPPTARRILSGLTGQDFACHSGAYVKIYPHTPLVAPWRGTDREGEKTRLFKYVRTEPDGVPLAKVVRDVFGDDLEAGDSEYQLARRFYKRYPESFKIDKRDGLLWVEPRLGVFNLRQQYAKRKTSAGRGDGDQSTFDGLEATGDRGGGGLSGVEGRRDNSGDGRADSPTYPKDRVQSLLDRYLQFPSDNSKQSLLREFVTEQDTIADKWQVFERIRGTGDDYLCMPYRTRHNDSGRAGGVLDGFEYALESAGKRHNRAAVLTVTTNPKQHSGLSDALDSLTENRRRLLAWLSTEYQVGYRPENLSVLEFSESGLPHYHIVLFGVSWAVSQASLAAKWQEYGQGSVVDIRTAKRTHDGDTWLLHDDRQGRVSLSWYLGQAIRELLDVAESDVSDLRDRVESGDVSIWRQVLYWATGRQYYSCSPSLRRPTTGDDLPHVTVWRFVGAATYQNLPAHVRRQARFAGIPPPGSSSMTGTAAGTG